MNMVFTVAALRPFLYRKVAPNQDCAISSVLQEQENF